MSHMSRKEILDLQTQFKNLCTKIEETQGYGLPHPAGLEILAKEFKRSPEGPPSLKLRNLGKLLKHYIEEGKKKPGAVVRFNVAAGMVNDRGVDVQQAIRRARVLVKDSVTQMEQEGYCSASIHTELRVDKHSRVLEEILSR